MTPFRIAGALLAAFFGAGFLLVAGTPSALLAATVQTTDFASQSLGRGYWHMFAAYAIAWLLVLGWAFSMARRLADVERRLDE